MLDYVYVTRIESGGIQTIKHPELVDSINVGLRVVASFCLSLDEALLLLFIGHGRRLADRECVETCFLIPDALLLQ
jgi:hypothetical protein